MKNIFLLIFTFISISLFSQEVEIRYLEKAPAIGYKLKSNVSGIYEHTIDNSLNKGLNSSQIFIGNESNEAQARSISGDASLSELGALTVIQGTTTEKGKVRLANDTDISGSDASAVMTAEKFNQYNKNGIFDIVNTNDTIRANNWKIDNLDIQILPNGYYEMRGTESTFYVDEYGIEIKSATATGTATVENLSGVTEITSKGNATLKILVGEMGASYPVNYWAPQVINATGRTILNENINGVVKYSPYSLPLTAPPTGGNNKIIQWDATTSAPSFIDVPTGGAGGGREVNLIAAAAAATTTVVDDGTALSIRVIVSDIAATGTIIELPNPTAGLTEINFLKVKFKGISSTFFANITTVGGTAIIENEVGVLTSSLIIDDAQDFHEFTFFTDGVNWFQGS